MEGSRPIVDQWGSPWFTFLPVHRETLEILNRKCEELGFADKEELIIYLATGERDPAKAGVPAPAPPVRRRRGRGGAYL